MENLLASRTLPEGSPTKLQNLSPQKYGKSAFANLTYTPSKLADNILYRQVTTQKKVEESSSKLRQTEAMKSLFQDRLCQLREQKEGIEKSLTEQISMYKKMLKDAEEKHQNRIKSLQQTYDVEIEKILQAKEEQAKYAQSQRQLLEQRIEQLERIVASLRDELAHIDGNYADLKKQNENSKIMKQQLEKKLTASQQAGKQQAQRLKGQIQQLRRQLYNSEIDAKNSLEQLRHEKDKQIESLERLHRNQLEKVESKRAQEYLLKNQQLKDLAATFEKQTARLNSIIEKKQDMLDQMSKLLEAEKEKNYNLSKGYQGQIGNLAHEKTRLKEEMLKAERRAEKLAAQLEDLRARFNSQGSGRQSEISNLKKDLELNRINYMRQVEKNAFVVQDLEKELARLRIQNGQASELAGENASLHRQLRNMKELLMESSMEMERCKQEFVRLGRQKQLLVIKLRQIGLENETLYRIKNDREEEARGWRDSYYITKALY